MLLIQNKRLFYGLFISLSFCLNSQIKAQDLEAISLEAGFNDAATQVESRLLNAPEASYVYLEHWINVYENSNSTNTPRLIILPPRPKKLQTAANIPNQKNLVDRNTKWHPNGLPIISPEWRYADPISFERPSRFRPALPPPIESEDFKKDLQDVLIYGDLHSKIRTPEQSLISAYWANGTGTNTPPGRWNLIALETTQNVPRDTRIKIMLLLNIALYDASIAAWDAKYHYDYWRPQTAISKTNNEFADWEPMMQPPFHPEYVSGHSTFSGAAETILNHFINDQSFCITAKELSNVEMCYDDFNQAAEEAGRSRIYGGASFRIF